MELAFDMSLATREFALARLRRKYPEKQPSDIMKAYIEEVLIPATRNRKNR